MQYVAPAADAPRPGAATTGIDDAVDQPDQFNQPPASSSPRLPLLALPPQAQGNAPLAPTQLPLFAAPRRPQGTYWSLISPSGALLPVTDPSYQQPHASADIQPTLAPAPASDVQQQTGTQAWPGEQARSNYWQATHGVDTGPALVPEADNSPWASVDWQHTPFLGPMLQMGEAFGRAFRAGQVPRAASPHATYRAAQAGDDSYMPSFQQTGPSLRDVVTGIPGGLADTARMATTPPPMPKGAYLLDGGAVQGTADPQEWRAWVSEMQRRADLRPSLAVQMLGAGTFAKPGAPWLAAAPRGAPEAVGQRVLQRAEERPPRLPNSQVEPFAPRPADLPDVDLAALEARAQEIHAALGARAQRHRTTAVLSTNEKTIIGGGKRDLARKQRALLRDDEVPAEFPGKHAEITVLWKALARGHSPRALATSRPICPECRPWIEAFGGKLVSPTLAIFPTR